MAKQNHGDGSCASEAADAIECLLLDLRKLREKWLKRSNAEIGQWYNDCGSIEEFIDDLDELLETSDD
jgi:hypothetical protein